MIYRLSAYLSALCVSSVPVYLSVYVAKSTLKKHRCRKDDKLHGRFLSFGF